MANIRITCPTCKAELEIGEEHIGQEVECGSCLQAFTAEDPKSKKKPYKMRRPSEHEDKDEDDDDDDRPTRRKRRRRDEDDDFDDRPPRTRGDNGSGAAVASLVLGILSFPMLCCCHINVPFSIAGIVCGIIGMQKPQSKGTAVAGLTLSVLSLLIYGGLLVFGIAFNAMNFNNGRFR